MPLFEYTARHATSGQMQRGQLDVASRDEVSAYLRKNRLILVGELRDLETIAAALTITETGHLCLATLHTNSAAESINRIIDVFPSNQQSQVRAQLAFVLEGVITQTLLPKAKGRGRVMACEIMVANCRVKITTSRVLIRGWPRLSLIGFGASRTLTRISRFFRR